MDETSGQALKVTGKKFIPLISKVGPRLLDKQFMFIVEQTVYRIKVMQL